MLKKLIAATLGLFVAVAFAASVDANKASQAELEALKGVGPGIATKILDERKKGAFKDWADMVDRVKGVGEGSAAKLSAEGLTVNGAAFKPTAAAPAAKKDEAKVAKAEMKADAKAKPTPAAATPATPAVAATPAMPAKPAPTVAAAADEAKKATVATQTAKAAAAKASEPAKK